MNVLVDDAMTVGAAAQVLEVTPAQVRLLGRRGDVTFLARGLLDRTSVHALRAARQGLHTRAWSGRTAWAAIALLTDQDASWLGQAQLSRLRARLRDSDASGLVSATRNRARVQRYSGHPAATVRLEHLKGTVRRRSVQGLVPDLPPEGFDGYVEERDLDRLVSAHGLKAAVHGRFVLRAVETSPGAVTLGLVATAMGHEVLAALDSATSVDPRERGVAMRALDAVLDEFRSRA